MMKKIIGLTLTLVMVISMIQVPVSAAETKFLYHGFDSLTAGAAISSTNGGVFDKYSNPTTLKLPSETGSAYTQITGWTSSTTMTVESRGNGDNALKIVSSEDKQAGEALQLRPAPSMTVDSAASIVHISMDFRMDDMSCDKAVTFMYNTAGANYSFIKFLADGTYSFYGYNLGNYSINTWYDFDIYYNCADAYWYLFVNDEYKFKFQNNISLTNIRDFRIQWTSPAATQTTVWLDNIGVGEVAWADLEEKLPFFFTGFDNLKSNTAFGTTNGAYYNTYGTVKWYNGSLDSDTGWGSTGSEAPRASATIVERIPGNNALMVEAGTTVGKSLFMGAHVSLSVAANDVIHFGFDFRTDDYSCEKELMVEYNSGSQIWNFAEFCPDGMLYIFDQPVAVYDTNEWYEFDAYYDNAGNMWYFFVNDSLVYSCSTTQEFTKILKSRFTWTSPLDVVTTVYLDNFTVDNLTSAELTAIQPATPTANAMKAVKNTVDGKLNVMVNMSAANNEFSGKLIAALYNGTELVEVLPYDAVATKYVTFTKTGDNAKIMWWSDTDSNITPKVVAIPVSFVSVS